MRVSHVDQRPSDGISQQPPKGQTCFHLPLMAADSRSSSCLVARDHGRAASWRSTLAGIDDGGLVIQYLGDNAGRAAVESRLAPGVAVL
jgi:hypothetical protein